MSMTLTPLADDVIERFATVPAANVADAQERFGVASGLVPMWRGARLAGPALTVWTRPGDNLYIHRALDIAQPGDIIVINGLGDLTRALIGDLIGIRAKALGIGGFVIDGAVRDADALAECGMPVFARAGEAGRAAEQRREIVWEKSELTRLAPSVFDLLGSVSE